MHKYIHITHAHKGTLLYNFVYTYIHTYIHTYRQTPCYVMSGLRAVKPISQFTNSVCLTVEEVAAPATGQKLPRDSPCNSDL